MARQYLCNLADTQQGNVFLKTSSVDWTSSLSNSGFSGIFSYSPDNTIVVTGGNGGVSFQTFDGVGWTYWSNATPSNFPTLVRSIEHVDGNFLFVGDLSGQCFVSSDLVNWNAYACTLNTSASNRMVSNRGALTGTDAVAIVRGTSTIKYSSNGGVTWSNPSSGINTATYGNIVGLCYDTKNSLFGIITYLSGPATYYLHYSVDGGVTWNYTGPPGVISGLSSTLNSNFEITKMNPSTGASIAWSPGSTTASLSTISGLSQFQTITLPASPTRVMWDGSSFKMFTSTNGRYYSSSTGATGTWTLTDVSGVTWQINDYLVLSETVANTLPVISSTVTSSNVFDFLNRDINVNTTVEVDSHQNNWFLNERNGVPVLTSNVTIQKTESRFWSQPWSMIYAESKWVGVKNGTNTGATSTDGATWTARTLPSVANWNGIAHDGTSFVTIAENSDKAAYSADGITWSASTLPSNKKWHAIVAGGSTIVAVAIESDVCAVSTDGGVNWTEYSMPVFANWTGIAWSGTTFVAITDSDVAATSSNGTTWTQRTMPDDIHYNSVAYGLGKFMAVASGKNPNATTSYAATSTDGITWTRVTMPQAAEWTNVGVGIGDPNV